MNSTAFKESTKINIKPLDITNSATFAKTLEVFEDPDDIMAVVNGPKYPRTHPQEYTANVNLHANGDANKTIYDTMLDQFGNNLLNSGFGNTSEIAGVTEIHRWANYQPKEYKVARTGNLTIFNDTNIEVKENSIARGQNMERNYGPNTIGRYNYVVGNFEFDVTKTVPNVILVHNFLNKSRLSFNIQSRVTLSIIKISTLNANIRTNTPFPHFNIPFPTDNQVCFLDLSSLVGVPITNVIARYLADVSYTVDQDGIYSFVDMSDSIEGEFSFTTINDPVVDINDTATASIIARILDDTLTRQDIRWALFLGARPLPRTYAGNVHNMSANNSQFMLDVYLPIPHNRDTYLKWLTKTNYDHTEYTLSSFITNHTFACNLIRDVRICKTFLIQVSAYTAKISYIPDSNPLFTEARYSQLLGFNFVNLGALYTATYSESTPNQFSHWLAWIPYEVAKSTNNTVKFDIPKWRRSRNGRQVADHTKRPRSIAFDKLNTLRTATAYNVLDQTLALHTGYTNRTFVVRAIPVSLYWNTVSGDVFTVNGFSEDDLVEDNYLEEYDYFPELEFEQSWN